MPKANPDYSNSCLNLTNPDSTREALELWRGRTIAYLDAEGACEAAIPAELRSLRAECAKSLDAARESLKVLIDSNGSYQDTANGHYAVKQSRNSTVYDPTECRFAIPQFASAVIEETVNSDKIKGLLKSGLITEKDVEKFITKMPLAPAYIIK